MLRKRERADKTSASARRDTRAAVSSAAESVVFGSHEKEWAGKRPCSSMNSKYIAAAISRSQQPTAILSSVSINRVTRCRLSRRPMAVESLLVPEDDWASEARGALAWSRVAMARRYQ